MFTKWNEFEITENYEIRDVTSSETFETISSSIGNSAIWNKNLFRV